MTIQYNNPVGADYQGIDGIEKVTCSRSTGRLHFFPTRECDRQQLLLFARPLSLSSKNTATTKAQIRSGSIANMPPTPSATNSPRYPTSLTIAESDFDNCLPIGPIVLL